uniref:Uncharacterized protein n=1 Tax=Rhizophora mucronata TaxID=61149 RepID=A0A2P2N9T4_RHIMU
MAEHSLAFVAPLNLKLCSFSVIHCFKILALSKHSIFPSLLDDEVDRQDPLVLVNKSNAGD